MENAHQIRFMWGQACTGIELCGVEWCGNTRACMCDWGPAPLVRDEGGEGGRGIDMYIRNL